MIIIIACSMLSFLFLAMRYGMHDDDYLSHSTVPLFSLSLQVALLQNHKVLERNEVMVILKVQILKVQIQNQVSVAIH
jgi:hypothetical protein